MSSTSLRPNELRLEALRRNRQTYVERRAQADRDSTTDQNSKDVTSKNGTQTRDYPQRCIRLYLPVSQTPIKHFIIAFFANVIGLAVLYTGLRAYIRRDEYLAASVTV